MPHSLRVKIKKLRYKGVITDKDCDRLIIALDNMDALNEIRAEIKEHADRLKDSLYGDGMRHCLEIIDKYKAGSEE